jgi:hypothetical protein
VNLPDDFFAAVVSRLNACQIPYMVTGSVASSSHSQPRSTNDLDIIIDPTGEALRRFLDSLPSDWYASREAALSALNSRSMFNIIEIAGGWKADLIIRGNRPFDIEEFNRRTNGITLGIEAVLITPEDSILSKLDWSRNSQSPRQFEDAVGVAAANLAALDLQYLRKWAAQLGVESRLEQVLEQARRTTSA